MYCIPELVWVSTFTADQVEVDNRIYNWDSRELQ
jgi:hypothetical protein